MGVEWPDAGIAIVDDEPAYADMLAASLRLLGYERVWTETDPAEFLDRVEGSTPDLLLLDLHMPGLDGLGVLQRLEAILPPEERPIVVVLTGLADESLRERAFVLGATDFLTKSGDRVEFELRVANLLRLRRLQRAHADHARQLEQEVRTRTADLRASLHRERATTGQLRQHHEAKDRILVSVSHELRAPLSVVRALAQTLQRRGDLLDPEVRADLLDRLVGAADRLERLLDDLVDVNRGRRGAIVLERHLTDVQSLIDHVVKRVDVGGRSVTIVGEPVDAAVDVAKLERIIENLVVNAVKHTPPETSITIRFSELEGDEGGLELVVSDDGPGVAPEERERIFDLFEQGRPSADGSGIGLALVRTFVELHGGHCWVDAAPGGGAAFTVQIPGKASAADEELATD